jgi:chemosensory pili system protein ChpC
MNDAVNDIRCMLIPLHEGRLLLPNAGVAEVIGYRDPERVMRTESWLRGEVHWHQREIPVVDFERLRGQPRRKGGVRQRIVVCYAADGELDRPLVGLIAQGIPRLLRVNPMAIEDASKPLDPKSPVLMTLQIDGEQLLVPDIDHVVKRCSAAFRKQEASA